MKTSQFALLLSAAVIIAAGVWYPTYQRAQREAAAAIAIAKASRLATLGAATKRLEYVFGINCPADGTERQREESACITLMTDFATLGEQAGPEDRPLIMACHDAFFKAAQALNEGPKNADEATALVALVAEESGKLDLAKTALEDRFRDLKWDLKKP